MKRVGKTRAAQILGRRGGKRTLERHGRAYFVRIGRKGGRPRLPNLPAQAGIGGQAPKRVASGQGEVISDK